MIKLVNRVSIVLSRPIGYRRRWEIEVDQLDNRFFLPREDSKSLNSGVSVVSIENRECYFHGGRY